MLRIKIIFNFIIFIFSMHGIAHADICIEEKITTNIPGRIFQGIKKTYITKNKILLEDPTIAKRVIYDHETNKVYLIDDSKKDLSVYSLNNFTLPSNDKIYSDFIPLRDEDILYKESGNNKKVGNYDCYEVVAYIPKIAAISRVWLTKDIEASLTDFFLFIEKNNDSLLKKMMPMMKESNNYVVESITIIVRPKESEKYLKTELVKISVQEVPDSLFKLPEDYRKLNMEDSPAASP
ncbi:MAG: DUF4412 domain-containing protein [Spirochaetes bacterium]|nr:DUF4412 domain-containing protein [Spirochaetota bacterium]